MDRKVAYEKRMSLHPKWINPCGIHLDLVDGTAVGGGGGSAVNGGADVSDSFRQVSDAEMLQQIVLQAEVAYSRAQHFKNEFARKAFEMDFETALDYFKNINEYDWLPQLPKQLGETLPIEYLSQLEIGGTLLDAYEFLQRIAVGLEQVTWSAEDDGDEPLRQRFDSAEHGLRSVLCELQMTMYERAVQMRPDVQRTIMSDSLRAEMTDHMNMNVRNFVIFRSYINCLEYVLQVFQYLKNL